MDLRRVRPRDSTRLSACQRIDGPAGPQARRALHIHVFDWQGKLRAVWALDRPASTIAVSGDSVLYATGQHGAGLYRYRLPLIPQ